MKHRYPHKIECAIRALKHGAAASEKLGTYLVEQQLPDFKKQNHLFGEAERELKRALKWARAGKKSPRHQ